MDPDMNDRQPRVLSRSVSVGLVLVASVLGLVVLYHSHHHHSEPITRRYLRTSSESLHKWKGPLSA